METVTFRNDSGEELVGDLWKNTSDAAVIMVHGLGGNRHEWGYFDSIARTLHRAGFTVLQFDLSASGESEGDTISVAAEVSDLQAAITYMRDQGIERIGLFGHSMGGLVCLKQTDGSIMTRVLTAPVTAPIQIDTGAKGYLLRASAQLFGKLPAINLDRPQTLLWYDAQLLDELAAIDQQTLLESVDSPALIVHGDQDEIVPISHSEQAVRYLEEGTLEILPGMTHDYGKYCSAVAALAVNWFYEHMEP